MREGHKEILGSINLGFESRGNSDKIFCEKKKGEQGAKKYKKRGGPGRREGGVV